MKKRNHFGKAAAAAAASAMVLGGAGAHAQLGGLGQALDSASSQAERTLDQTTRQTRDAARQVGEDVRRAGEDVVRETRRAADDARTRISDAAQGQVGASAEQDFDLGASFADSDSQNGLSVENVTRGSVMADAGLQSGDSILEVDGAQVTSEAQLREQLQAARSQRIPLAILRNGNRQTIYLSQALRSRIFANAAGGAQPAGLGVDFRSDSQGGVVVTNVYDGSPAATMGLQAGDRILAIDDQRVGSNRQFLNLIRQRRPGDSVAFAVLRNGQRRQFTAQLASRQQALNVAASRQGQASPGGAAVVPQIGDLQMRVQRLEQELAALKRSMNRDDYGELRQERTTFKVDADDETSGSARTEASGTTNASGADGNASVDAQGRVEAGSSDASAPSLEGRIDVDASTSGQERDDSSTSGDE